MSSPKSKIPVIAQDDPGKKVIMLGNEAIARGILEAGVVMMASYPGTPSSEITPAVARCFPHHPHLLVEWSTNEKVAFEIAYAGSMSNVRSVTAMKHVGLNVASDAFMTACYHGVRELGGMVVISADDPSQFSSQNEQDNRYYGLHALVPVFEPSCQQEAKDMIKYAFQYSEENNSIVLFRTTTRLNHGRGDVEFGEIIKPTQEMGFDWDRNRWVCVPTTTRPQRIELLQRMEKMTENAEFFPFNHLTLSDKQFNGKKFGLIAAGIAYSHLMDVLDHFGIQDQVSILKIGLVNPLPKKHMVQLMEHVDELLVVEELEPIFEEQFKALAYEKNLASVRIHGKDILPQNGELTPETLLAKIAEWLSLPYDVPQLPELDVSPPPRFPQMCPACSHRNVYWIMKELSKKLKKKLIKNNDIGCYSLGVYKPLEMADTALCMGGSIGMANGFAKLYTGNEDVIVTALLGDSTFYHSGIPGLINAVYNQNDLLLIISDNSYTSMTGGQNNPGNGLTIFNEPGTQVDLAGLVKGCGVPEANIFVHEAYDIPGLTEKMEQALTMKGVRVIIPQHMCSLQEMRIVKRQKIIMPVIKVNEDLCIGCQKCSRSFGCPAIGFDYEKRKSFIIQEECRSCKSCITFGCPKDAFYVAEE
jgi:indolepyruvate ferredoxin oxidoreductase alpha subunit